VELNRLVSAESGADAGVAQARDLRQRVGGGGDDVGLHLGRGDLARTRGRDVDEDVVGADPDAVKRVRIEFRACSQKLVDLRRHRPLRSALRCERRWLSNALAALGEVEATLRHRRDGHAVAGAEILRPDQSRVDGEARAEETGVGQAVSEEIEVVELCCGFALRQSQSGRQGRREQRLPDLAHLSLLRDRPSIIRFVDIVSQGVGDAILLVAGMPRNCSGEATRRSP
jgi:hypothetical protein